MRRHTHTAECGAIHVRPVGDVIEHEWEDCACLPVCEPVLDDDGQFLEFMYVHNAWDGRD